MGDDLETILAADEAAISDAGFAARVAASAHDRSILRRGWLAGVGLAGLVVAVLSVASLTAPLETAIDQIVPARLVFSLPVIDLSLQMPHESLMAVALGLAMLVGLAAVRFASDDL